MLLPSKRHRSRSIEAKDKRIKIKKHIYNLREPVCRISPAQAERACDYGNGIKDHKDIEVTQNFPDAQRMLIVIRAESVLSRNGQF